MRQRPGALAAIALLIAAAAMSAACGAAGSPTAQPSAAAAVSASPRASVAAAGHIGAAALYPDPKLTPGDVIAGVTAQQVCTPGYASRVRAVSVDEKRQVYARYGEKDLPGAAEVDHFIPLELGGSNALTNLWPERYSPKPGAHEKDDVENYLHEQVCSGALTLQQAQDEIRGDWYAVYQQIAGR